MRVYLDYNATTPVREEVLEEMLRFTRDIFGNPSSQHSFGREAKREMEAAREKVADFIGCEAKEIIFTSGGTEADNLAIFGIAFSQYPEKLKRKKIIVSSIEHKAVLEPAKKLKKLGFDVHFLEVTPDGFVNVEKARELIDENTLLVSIMYANNEIGTIQPISEIVKIAKEKGAFVHTDLVATVHTVKVNVKELEVDLASISAHKIYGPKGVGALFVRRGIAIERQILGGQHENLKRAGTENTPGIVGFGKACELLKEEIDFESRKLKELRDYLEERIIKEIPYVIINGKNPRIPNTLNVSFAFVEGETLLTMLDMAGIAVSSGSACSSETLEPSHVITAIGVPKAIAHGTVRFSLGKYNEKREVDYTLDRLKESVEKIRAFSPIFEDFVRSNKSFEEFINELKERESSHERVHC